jgi:hypothetical protein
VQQTLPQYRLQAEAADASKPDHQADGAHGPIVNKQESGSSDESSDDDTGLYTGMFAALSHGYKKAEDKPAPKQVQYLGMARLVRSSC